MHIVSTESNPRFRADRLSRVALPTEQQQLEAMQAFAVRWTQSQSAVAAFIATLVPRHHDAEDILQRTAASLVAMRDQYDPSRPFVSWAIGVARIEVLRFRQAASRERASFDTPTVEAIAQAFVRSEDDLSEMQAALDGCIAKLNGRMREVFEMHYVANLKPSEIAQKLGRKVNAVFLAMHRARAALRQCMERSLHRRGGTL